MSQPPHSPIRSGDEQFDALARYRTLMAMGHFNPSTYVTLDRPVSGIPPLEQSSQTPPQSSPQTPSKARYGTYATANMTAAAPTHNTSPRASSLQTSWQMSPGQQYETAPTAHMTMRPPQQSLSYPSDSTMPRLASPYYPQNFESHRVYGGLPSVQNFNLQPVPLAPNSITKDTLSARVQDLLRQKLPEFEWHYLVMLSTSIVNRIIHLGVTGQLGPHGLQNVNDILMVIGHEGTKKYMALAVKAPIKMCMLLKGLSEDLNGREPLTDTGAMDRLRQGFFNVAVSEYNTLNRDMKGGGR